MKHHISWKDPLIEFPYEHIETNANNNPIHYLYKVYYLLNDEQHLYTALQQ